MAIALAVCTLSPAWAADDNWINPSTTPQTWSTGSNWSLGTAPTTAQSAAILNGGIAKIDSTVAFSSLTIGSNSQVQLLAGNNLFDAGAIINNGSLRAESAGSLSLYNAISGTGSVTVRNGTLTLSGANTYSGGTTVTAGRLVQSSDAELGDPSGRLTLVGGELYFLQPFTLNKARTIAISHEGGATFIVPFGNSQIDGDIISVGDPFRSDGNFTVTGNGRLTLTGTSTFDRLTFINAGSTLALAGTASIASTQIFNEGTFDISSTTAGAYVQTLNGHGLVNLGSKTLTIDGGEFSGTTSATNGGITDRNGDLTISNTMSYTGPTTILHRIYLVSNGSLGSSPVVMVENSALDISGTAAGATLAELSGGNGGVIYLGSKTLTINGAGTSSFAGSFRDDSSTTGGPGGKGGNVIIASGTHIFTGTLAQTGTTTINPGATLQLGDGSLRKPIQEPGDQGGTLGVNVIAGSGRAVNNGTLVFNRAVTSEPAGVISGTGTVIQAGIGNLILSGVNTYTGGTIVKAGTLTVTGTVGAVSVASGGTLTGIGSTGTISVAGGGTLSPGTGGVTGTLSVAGNLALASGANYVTTIDPTTAAATAVTGTASLDGALTANAAAGTYSIGQTYTLISAAGGVSGTFAALATPDLPAYVKGRLSYDTTHVFLNLDTTSLAQSLPADAPAGQAGITATIDAAVQSGTAPNSGITSLFKLSGDGLGAALNQATGDVGAKTSQAAGQSFSPFFNLLMERGATNNSLPVASNAAPEGVRPAQLAAGTLQVWGSIYGGHSGMSADTASTTSLSSDAFGLAGGMEKMFDGQFMAGASIGFGHQNFRSGGGNGKSDDVILGLYGRKNVRDRGYISAALAYGWHDITTRRVVTISGTDVLTGKPEATEFGGRAEGGWRFAVDEHLGLTPFLAFAGANFHTPAYTETASSGSANFALGYTKNDTFTSHTELGARLGRDFQTADGTLSLEGELGWAHQLSGRPFVQANFQGLAGPGFVLLGVKPDINAALLGLDLQMHNSSGMVYGVRVQDQVGGRSNTIAGALNLAYQW